MSRVFITSLHSTLDPYFGDKALVTLRQFALVQINAHGRELTAQELGGLTRRATDYQALKTVQHVASILHGKVPHGAVNPERANRCAFLAVGGPCA